MRFVPPIAALADGTAGLRRRRAGVRRDRWTPLLGALAASAPPSRASHMALPFTLTGRPELRRRRVTVDASASSQFVCGLLLAGARYAHGLDIRHIGRPDPIPSAHRR